MADSYYAKKKRESDDKVQKALEERKKQKDIQGAAQKVNQGASQTSSEERKKASDSKVEVALTARQERIQNSLPSIYSDIGKLLNVEIDSYNGTKPTYGAYEETYESQRERRISISKLRDKVNAYRNYMEDGFADEILSTLDNMERGYDAYLSMSKYETKDDYDTAVRQYGYWQEYQGMGYLSLRDELSKLEKGSEKYNWLQSYMPSELTENDIDSAIAEVDKEIGSLSKFIDQWGNLDVWYNDYMANPDSASFDLTDEQVQERIAMHKAIMNRFGSYDNMRDALYAKKQEMYDLERHREYGLLEQNDDFKTVSADVATELPKGWGALTADATYLYINDVGGYRTQTASQGAIGGRGNSDEIYAHMEEDEISRYNYLYNKEGKSSANAYLEYLKPTLNARQQQKVKESAANFANEAGGWASVASIPVNMLSILGLADVLGQNVSKFWTELNTGEFGGYIDYNRPTMTAYNTSSTIREVRADYYNQKGTIELKEEDHPILSKILNGKGWGDVYQLGMSMADSYTIGKLTGLGMRGGTVLLGGSAGTQGMLDALERGATDEQAVTMGVLNAIFEALFEKVSIDNLINGESRNIVMSFLTQGFIEGTEELSTSFANNVADIIVMAEKSNWQRNIAAYIDQGLSPEDATKQAFLDAAIQMGWDFVGGVLSGGIMGGGNTALEKADNYTQTVKQNIATGRSIMETEGAVDSLMALADDLAGVTTGKEQKNLMRRTETLSAKMDKGSTSDRTALRVFKLHNAVKGAYGTQNHADIVKALTKGENGFSTKEANKIAGALVAMSNGLELTEAQTNLLSSVKDNPAVQGIVESMNSNDSPIGQRNMQLRQLERDVTINAINKAITKQVTEKEFTPEGIYETSSGNKAIRTDTNEEIDIKGVKEIGNGKLVLELSDGQTIDVKNVSFANEADALIYEAVGKLGDNIDFKSANQLIAQYKGGDAMVFARGIAQAYTYGFYGIDKSELFSKHSLADKLTDQQREFAYNLGKEYRPTADKIAKDRASEKMAKTGKTPGEKGVYFRDKDGNATDIDTYLEQDGRHLNDLQKSGIEMMHKMSEMMGIRFNVFESWTENGKSYYLDQNGKVVEGDPNGFYDTVTGEIYIALNAGSDYQGTMVFTIAHEVTHFMRQWSPEHFRKIAEIVFQHGGMKGTVSELIALKQANAKAKGKPISYDVAMEEVVADGMETILKNGKVVQFMADVKQKDQKGWQKLKGWFMKLAKFLRSYIGRQANTVEGRKVSEFSKDLLSQIEQIYAEGAVEGGSYYQETVDGYKAEQAKFSTANMQGNADGAVVQSDATTAIVESKQQPRTEYEAFPKQVMSLSDGSGTLLHSIEGLTPTKLKGLSGRTVNGYTGRDVRAYAMGISGFTQAQIQNVNEFMDSMADFMEEAGVTYKFIGLQDVQDAKLHYTYNSDGSIKSIVLSAMVKNGDYPVNFDLSSICKKREAMSKLVDILAKSGSLDNGTVKLTPDNIFKINTALKDAGYETACLGCFVESKRYNSLEWAKKFCDKWNAAVKKVNPNATYFGYGNATFNEDSFTLEQAIKIEDAANKYIKATKTERLANALKKYQAKADAGQPLVASFSKAARDRLIKSDTISDELKDTYLNSDVSTWNMADVEFLLENGVLPGASLSNKQAVTEMVKSGEAYQHLLRPSDLLTDRGISKLEALPNFHGVLYGHYGSGTPKLMQSYTPYNSEIALLPANKNKDQSLEEYLYSIAGVRMQSFSDFQIQNIYDYLQMVADLSARKLPAHAYTKEISFAKLLGMTGIKTNLSVMFDIDPMVDKAHAGLTKLNKLVHRGEYAKVVLEDEQGKWVYNIGDYQTQRMFAEAYPDEAKRFLQSIGFADAVKLQTTPGYSANCGIIGVGYSDLGIFAMLNDKRIRYIIPYHASSLPADIKVATNIALGTDYTPYQNNMKISEITDRNGNKVNWTIKEAYKRLGSGQAVINELNEKIRTEGWVVKTTKAQTGHGSYGLYENLQETNDPRQTASNFMDWCIGNGTLPLFYQFASHENYYKLIYDYNVYDCVTEEYAPQQAVTNTYPTMVDGQVQPGNVTDGGFDTEYLKGTVDKQMAFMNAYNENRDADLEKLAENMEEGNYTLFSERKTFKNGQNAMGEFVANILIDLADMDSKWWTGVYNHAILSMSKTDDTEFTQFYQEILKRTKDMDEYGATTNNTVEDSFTVQDGKGREYIYVVELDGYLHGVVHAKINKAKYLSYVKKYGGSNNYGGTPANTVRRVGSARANLGSNGSSGSGSQQSNGNPGSGGVVSVSPQGYMAGNDEGKGSVDQEVSTVTDSDNQARKPDHILMGSLFSGGGTLEAGLVYQMLDKQFGVEYDGKIASVYADNHGDHIQVGKVEDFDISKYDDIFYLHASPVCHNFSKAKHGAKELAMDINSAKATAKHLETAMPQVFTVENAPAYRKSESLKIITDKLTELGYKWDVDVYNSADYGSATSRNRVILRAVKDGELPAKPEKQERTNSWDKVTRDLWDTLPKSYLRPSFISAIENTRNLPILDADGKVNVNKPLLILTTTSGHTVTYCWEGDICPTLTTKCGEARLVMPDGNIYAVTPEFMGRIQGLPDDYKYPKEKTRAFTIIGNGIPTHLTKAVVGGVLDSAYEQTHDGQALYSDRDYVAYDRTAILKEETVDKWLRAYATKSSPKYAQAYIAYMKPDQFLELTTSNYVAKQHIESESYALDEEKFAKATADQPLFLDIDHDTGEVYGHEGRHRCVALQNAGIEDVPVLLFDTSNKYSKEDIPSILLKGQFNKYHREFVFDAIPLSYENRDRVIQNFATQSNAQRFWEKNGIKNTLRYSDRDNAAVAEFGTTGNFDQAGFVLGDGKMLNLSMYGQRGVRHDRIEAVYEDAKGSEAVNRFIQEGHVRIKATSPGIEIGTEAPLTVPQLNVVSRFISNSLGKKGVFYLDITDPTGKNIASIEYDEDSSTSDIIYDIKAYYERGKVPTMRRTYFQERSEDSVSNRSLLATAFEGAAKTDIERTKIQEYKGKVSLIDAEERRLRELNEQIKELSFSKGPRDTKRIRELRDEATMTANRINTYDKQLLRLEASKPLQDVLAREKKRAYDKAAMEGRKALDAYKEKTAKTQRELLERWRDSRKRAVESRERTALRNKIRSVVGELNDLLLNEDKKRHVPDNLKKAVASALALVNMDTVGADERIKKYEALIAKETDPDKIDAYTITMENILRKGEKMGQKLKELRDAYEEIQNSDDPDIANGYDPVIAGAIKELSESIGDTSLKDMSIEQLSDVYDLYKMVLTRVRDANKSLIESIKESISSRASRVVGEVRAVGGDHKYRASILDPIKSFFWNNAKPVYAMEHIGSSTMTEAFNQVRKGEDTWAKDVTEARAYYLDKSKKYGYDSWDFDKKHTFKSTSEQEFELTLEQIMALYAYSKREQAHEHLRMGGFVFDSNIETYKENGSKLIKYKVNTADAHQLTPEILANIIGTLTEEQRGFVDEMQDYLSTVMGAKGNEVTMKMYGVKLFKEKFYFPLKSARQFMFEQNEVAGEVRIKNSGFTNKTKPKANNPVILNNFMDVWANHVNDMSMYHSFVLPLEDFNRIFNYNSPKEEGKPPVSVKGTIQNAYTPAAVNYVKQLITDLNGGAMSDPRETFAKAMTAKFKKAKVFSSLSVVIQQPSAIGRAFALVDPKYFHPTVDGMNHDELWAELKQYAPVAVIKEMGYFDVNMGRSTLDFIKAREYTTFKEKVGAVFTDADYRDELLSKAPALADELTWCAIWNAVKRETLAKNPGLDIKSEPFLMLAGARFTEVITKTQVYDSVLARSANMRSKSGLMSMVTAFMAEPTTSINMLEDAIRKGKRGHKGYAGRAFASVAVSILINNALVALVYGMRDDDEDETFAEKYMQSFVSGMLDDINPATYLPFIKDMWSLFQGFDVERADMSLVGDLADGVKRLVKAYSTEDGDVAEAWWTMAGAIANIGGIPMQNIRRDVNGIANFFNTIIEDVNGRATTWGSMGDALLSSVKDSTPIWGWFSGDKKSDNLYDAIMRGDTAYVERLKGSYATEIAYHSAVRTALRENDPRIMEAAKAGFNGDPSERVRIAKLIIADGFAQDDVVAAINAEINVMKPDEGSSGTKAKGYYTAEDFALEIANGDQASANSVKVDVIQTLQKNGKTAEEAEKSFANSAKSELKELYLAGKISKDKTISALTTYCGVERDDAVGDIQYWDFKQDYPEVFADDAWIDEYYNEVESSGISLKVFVDYRNKVKGITGEGKKEKRMEVINSMPISTAQKDALYYAEGWAASTIHEAPWH